MHTNIFEKRAEGLAGHAAEVAGLGILAAPHIYNLATGKKVKSKTERNTELAGLGVLAAPSIHAISKHLLTKKAMAEAFADEMDKIAGVKGALIGAGLIGAGTGTSATLREWERRRKEGRNPRLPNEERNRRRRERVVGIAGNTAIGATGGAAVGHYAGKATSNIASDIGDKVNKGVTDAAGQAMREHGGTIRHHIGAGVAEGGSKLVKEHGEELGNLAVKGAGKAAKGGVKNLIAKAKKVLHTPVGQLARRHK